MPLPHHAWLERLLHQRSRRQHGRSTGKYPRKAQRRLFAKVALPHWRRLSAVFHHRTVFTMACHDQNPTLPSTLVPKIAPTGTRLRFRSRHLQGQPRELKIPEATKTHSQTAHWHCLHGSKPWELLAATQVVVMVSAMLVLNILGVNFQVKIHKQDFRPCPKEFWSYQATLKAQIAGLLAVPAVELVWHSFAPRRGPE